MMQKTDPELPLTRKDFKVGMIYKTRLGDIVKLIKTESNLGDVIYIVNMESTEQKGYNFWLQDGHRGSRYNGNQDLIEVVSKFQHPEYFL